MANIAHLRHSPDLIEQAAYWVAEHSWRWDDFEELQELSKQLQELAPRVEKLRQFVEHIASRSAIYCITDEIYLCGCGSRWDKNKPEVHNDECIIAGARAILDAN